MSRKYVYNVPGDSILQTIKISSVKPIARVSNKYPLIVEGFDKHGKRRAYEYADNFSHATDAAEEMLTISEIY